MQDASVVMLMIAATLTGCAGFDGAVDRYTMRHQAGERTVAGLPPDTPPLAGLYGGKTTATTAGVACPPGIFSMLEVTRDGARYNDPINGVIAGPIGLGGQVALDHAGVRLDGRLAAGRFAGTISGGSCAYRLAFRRIGPASTVADVAPASVVSNQPSRIAVDDAETDDGRLEVAIDPASSHRHASRAAAEAEADSAASRPDSHPVRAYQADDAALVPPKSARSPAAEADRMLAQGRIAAARPLYERAATLGDGAAATALGKTYDPLFLANMHASGMHPDPQLAAAWYKRGVALGDPRASSRLSSLLAMQKQ